MGWSELPQIIKLLAALSFVVALMGGLALVLKKLGLAGPLPAPGGKKRLSLIEALPLDGRRRLLLLQRDDVQHLVILGPGGETVIETHIKAQENSSDDG